MILAIDSGTTGTTVLIVNRQGKVVANAYAELTQHYPKPGWVEHNPQEILQVTGKVIRKALRAGRIKPTQIQGIGITNQRETTILWNRRTGKPIFNAIVWQCRRTAPLCEQLQASPQASLIRRKTGLVIDAYFSGTKIRWILDHVSGARKRAARGELAFGTVDSWLLWHLTGGKAYATDSTNASRTLLFNIKRNQWDRELLRLFKVPKEVLPKVQPPCSLFGTTVAGLGLPAGIPIAGMAGDQQASMVGHGCLKPGTAKNTYGTGCFLLLNTGSRPVASRHGLITTLIHGPGKKPTYALEGSIFIAGAAIQWLRDELGLIRTASETQKIARSLKDTGGVYVVPAFVGLGAPYWDMGARGAVVGLTRGSNRAVLVRATLESLAYQTRDVMEAMRLDSKIRLKSLRVDGGAAQNDWLMQFQADLLGIPVLRPPLVANTGKGAALLAGAGIGWWKPDQLDRLADRPSRTFKPRIAQAERNRRIQGWDEAIERVKTRR